MINSINAYSTPQTGDAAAFKAASTAERTPNSSETKSTTSTQTGSTQTISTLARQLAESAAQNSTLNRSELANKAQLFHKEYTAEANPAIQAKHDSEVPKSKDPELLARAKQATAFMVANRHGRGEKNPFAGLSREQLANITYDNSGAYTFNERVAAYAETSRIENEWAAKVCTQVIDEYNSTGKMTNFFTAVLDHYNGLPAIEQAQYPKNYASDLESKIKLDFNYRTHRAEGKGEDPMSLIEMLLDKNPKQITAAQPSPPVTAEKSTAQQASG